MDDNTAAGTASARPSRRRVLAGGGVLAAGALAGAGAATAPATAAVPDTARDGDADGGDRRTSRTVTVFEGTNMAAALSPDGTRIAIDPLGAIWVMPADGGEAVRLTGELQDATQPDWAPDGSALVFQSFRDGTYQLWSVRPDGTGLTRLTADDYDNREPRHSPDGHRIVFTSDRSGSNDLWLLEPATGTRTRLTSGDDEDGMPGWSADGTRIVCTVNDTAVDAVDLATGVRTRLVTASGDARIYGPALSPDGRRLSYVQIAGTRADVMVDGRAVVTGADVHALRTSWISADELLYTANGRVQRLRLDGEGASRTTSAVASGTTSRTVDFSATVTLERPPWRHRVRDFTSTAVQQVKGIASPVVSPDGERIAFRALNALWVTGTRPGDVPVRLVDDGFFASDPDWSPDGTALVHVSDRAGTAALWRQDLAGGEPVRLTRLAGAQLTPRWSPDGTKIAYQDENGGTWVLDLASGTVRQVLPAVFQPGRPTWSPDSTRLAVAANKPYSRRNRAGLSEILSVDLATGTTRSEPVAPHRSIATRGDDGPVWTPDGRYFVFVMESTAWRVPVDTTGKVTGAPEQITTEVTDSLSVDSHGRLHYLSNGTLRTVPVSGGTPRTVPVPLTFRRPVGTRTVVLRAGAVWDGRGDGLRGPADIVVKGGRIAEIRPAGQGRGDEIVDLSGLTAMPGLIDSHVHWHMRGRQWGDRTGRLMLSYGITTVVSPADPAYQMVETREAIESGARVGPRFFGTGEALDGARVFYNNVRAVVDTEQLRLEMARVTALSYDLVKTYIRLPAPLERAVTRQAHERGLPVTSHYAYPQAGYGMDAMEHTGGGNRVGYSQTQTRLGRAYQDSVAVLTAASMPVTSTLLNSSVLLADDRSLVTDERTRRLYPPWDYTALVAKADAAGGPTAGLNRALLAGGVDMLLRIQRAGGTVVAGSDAPLDDPALSLHQNLRALVLGGFTPYEALRTATANPARRMGVDGLLGALAPGMLADLVFVEGDPLRDIDAAAAVRTVVTGGTVRTVDSLLAPFTPAAAKTRESAANPTARSLVSPETAHRYGWHDPRPGGTGCLC
ncbi:amidohydrolase family protein [Streptomyces sp. GMY02]|uniref:amidohydrolase family protein n=1 Tax=Streptomyces sp. GMY02 TaxID=1333528 RepID=UPI001C2C8874|nr:amidohydrolase family protein [Streptomyces sp. GMY02]QXE33746.1 amidohydrolase family protein [Streptomyces sp. GMY02]